MKRLIPVFKVLRVLSMAALTVGAVVALGNDHASMAATKYTAFVGGGRAGVAVETFRPSTIFVNVGDSVEFQNPYEEIHTVTYVGSAAVPDLIVPNGPPPKTGPPQLIFNPLAANPTASVATVDGSAYQNSGVLNKGQSWTATFPKQGLFKFLCLVHPGMESSVTVLAAGVFVPTQAQRDFEAQDLLNRDIGPGERSAASGQAVKSAGSGGTSTWDLSIAASVGQTDVNRFIPSRLQVGLGDTVRWNNNTFVPHTITFTSGAAVPDLVTPQFQGAGPPLLILNPQALFPSGAPQQQYAGTGFVNSGFIGAGPEATGGKTFAMTFTRAGTYSYLCILHADQGMAGVIEVGPQTGIVPPRTGDGGLTATDGRHVAAWRWYAAGGGLLGLALLALGRLRARAG